MYQIIDGKKISQEIKDELKEKVAALKEQGKQICLAVIQVGSDPASRAGAPGSGAEAQRG